MDIEEKEKLKKKWVRFYFNSLHTPEGYADWWLNKIDLAIEKYAKSQGINLDK